MFEADEVPVRSSRVARPQNRRRLLLTVGIVFWLVSLTAGSLAVKGDQPEIYVRVNQVGYLPSDAKVAIAFGRLTLPLRFSVIDDATQQVAFEGSVRAMPGRWGQFDSHVALDFSQLERPGRYLLRVGETDSRPFQIGAALYDELPDQLLEFMRQQRCGYNPWLDAVCHSFDGRTAYGPLPAGTYLDATGGWHDAGDLLKYLLTSSNATGQMLLAYQLTSGSTRAPHATRVIFHDRFNALGQPGANGVLDILDEARWGLDWMLKLHPAPDQLYHQVADDRDHQGWRLPQNETVDYGWGPGSYRVIYFADGRPQGLRDYKSKSNGVANLAGRYAAAMALGYQIWKNDPRLSPIRSAFTESVKRGLCAGQGRRRSAAGELVRCTLSLRGNYLGRRHGVGCGRTLSLYWGTSLSSRRQTLRANCRVRVVDGAGANRSLSVLPFPELGALSIV